MTFKELLIKLYACSDAKEWASDKTIEEVVNTCHRGDWLLWLAKRVDIDIRPLTLAKARCAKTVIDLMKDQRSIDAVNIAERFGLNECTMEELSAAYTAAYNTTTASVAAAFSATAAAFSATAATAATAAAAFSSTAAAAAATAAAANADYAVASDARAKNQKQTADICRDILGQLIVDRVNELLNHK